MIRDMQVEFPRELAASAALRDWLIGAGYMPDEDLEEDTPTEARGETPLHVAVVWHGLNRNTLKTAENSDSSRSTLQHESRRLLR